MAWHDGIDRAKARVLIDGGPGWDEGEEGVIVEQGIEEIGWNGYDVLIELEPVRVAEVVGLPFAPEGDVVIRQFYYRPGEWEEL